MKNKEFKAESKRLLDLMINSIYTNKEIFLREIISNASDAMDKIYYRSLTEKDISVDRKDLKIRIDVDKEKRILTISDRGIGMTEDELDKNLGTIAKSGSFAFKEETEKKEDIDIIGQFGVGFYSAFMVSDEVIVKTKAPGEDSAYMWKSKGADGYTIEKCEKDDIGTDIILHIKDDTEEEKYGMFLEEYKIKEIIKKYSDYIRYPIEMEVEHNHKKEGTDEFEKVKEVETLNSMVPIWKKDKKELKDEDYTRFYTEKFHDYEGPAKVIHTSAEGLYKYNALLFIPKHTPYDFYTKEYEKGLQLYASSVLIMEKCSDLIPDYFSFVKGIVDSEDLSLNISREMLQQDRQLKVIAKNIENKIKSELENMLEKDREKYEEIYKNFGLQLKYGTYADYGMNKDKLKDLLMFYSSSLKKLVTLKEYTSRMKEGQKDIYYASSDSYEKIDMMPQVEKFKDKGYEVLYLVDNVDEFVFQVMREYDSKTFKNVASENIDLDSDEEKENLKKINEENKELFNLMKEVLPEEVHSVRFTHRLKNHPVCLTTEGALSAQMEKTLSAMPNAEDIKAHMILEINETHDIAAKIKKLFAEDKEMLKKYSKVLYAEARLIEGLSIENPVEISELITEIMSK